MVNGKRYTRCVSFLMIFFVFLGCSGKKLKAESGTKVTKKRSFLKFNKLKTDQQKAEYYFVMGEGFSFEGDTDRAIEEYRLALVYDSTSAVIHLRLAAEYIRKGLMSSALEVCKKVVEIDPMNIDARLMLAGLYAHVQDIDAAVKHYDFVLGLDSTHQEAIVFKAQTLLEQQRTKEAVQVLNAFLKKTPKAPVVWYFLAKAYLRLENFNGAVKAFKKATENNKHFEKAFLDLGLLYELLGKTEEAIKNYQAAYENLDSITAAERLSSIYLKEEKFNLALPYLQMLRNNDPDNLNAQIKLGLVYMDRRDFKKSIEVFKGILKETPGSDRVQFYLATIYEEMKQYDTAIELFKKINPKSTLFEDATLEVAYLYQVVGEREQAKEHLYSSIKKVPTHSKFYTSVAVLEEKTNQKEKAIEILKSAVKVFPEDESVRYYLGSLYEDIGKVEESLQSMKEVIRINPKNADALNFIGYIWTTLGVRLEDAGKMLKKALALNPNNAFILDSWGWHLYSTGKINEAVVELEKAHSLKPKETVILDHLGDAYVKLNLRKKALKKYKDALGNTVEDKTKKNLVEKIKALEDQLAQETDPYSVPQQEDREIASEPKN